MNLYRPNFNLSYGDGENKTSRKYYDPERILEVAKISSESTDYADKVLRSSVPAAGSNPGVAVLLAYSRLRIEIVHLYAVVILYKNSDKYTQTLPPGKMGLESILEVLQDEKSLSDRSRNNLMELRKLAKLVRNGSMPSIHSSALYVDAVFRIIATMAAQRSLIKVDHLR